MCRSVEQNQAKSRQRKAQGFRFHLLSLRNTKVARLPISLNMIFKFQFRFPPICKWARPCIKPLNFSFKKLKPGVLEDRHIKDDRNKKYKGWTTEKLIDKIDEKITELKNIKKLNNGSVTKAKNNIPMMMSNLYYRMKLMADFIRSK